MRFASIERKAVFLGQRFKKKNNTKRKKKPFAQQQETTQTKGLEYCGS